MDIPISEQKKTYSWGEFYETTKACSEYSKEEEKRFVVFEALDKVTTIEEISAIVGSLTQEEINWLNSPCLDGIVLSILEPAKFMEKEYIETFKFYLDKKLIKPSTKNIINNHYYPNILTTILKNGIEIDKKELSEILDWTAWNDNNIDIAKLILERDADINFTPALARAAYNNCINITKLLLEKGADIYDNDIALYNASICGHIELVKLLLKRGADIHADNDAALRDTSGHYEVIKLLLENGADVHANNDEALRNASVSGQAEIVELLLNYGADINSISKKSFQRYPEIKKIVLKHGMNLPYATEILADNKFFTFNFKRKLDT